MKAVMLSIQPKWCELIASGKKTIEVRKTAPKEKEPFKCYIYCTKGTFDITLCPDLNAPSVKVADKGRGKVIGEYVCDRIDTYTFHKGLTRFGGELGLPIGTYDTYLIFEDDYNAMCLTYNEVKDYGKGKTLYGWHISDLKIYDKPKELWNFNYPCTEKECSKCQYEVREELPFDEIGVCCGRYHITRPFQSYGYVEPLEEIN